MATPGSSHRSGRTTWLVVAIASFVVPCVWLGSVYYLLGVRPKLAARA